MLSDGNAGQTGVCVVGGTGVLGEGELLKEAVALLDPALSQDEGRNYQVPLAANLHLSLFLWITPIKTKSSLRKLVPQDLPFPRRN